MKIVADLHTHTNVSTHAFSSLEEMISGAIRQNHIALAITNHAPAVSDSAHISHFVSIASLPKNINNIAFLAGAEANILPDGTIDIPEKICEKLDLILASIHGEIFPKTSLENVTDVYMKILQNPYVNILGHIGTEPYKFDYEKIISKCNEYKKVIEINNNSFKIRKGSYENCLEIAKLCKKYNVPISLNSDAHISFNVGVVDTSIEIIQQINFPKELIINISRDNLEKYCQNYLGIDIFNRK